MTPQPTCAGCGATEINWVRAAAGRWSLILGWPRCSSCARLFPAWMRTQL